MTSHERKAQNGLVDIPSETVFRLQKMPLAKPSPNPHHMDNITCAISLADLGRVTEGRVGLLTFRPRPSFIQTKTRTHKSPSSFSQANVGS